MLSIFDFSSISNVLYGSNTSAPAHLLNFLAGIERRANFMAQGLAQNDLCYAKRLQLSPLCHHLAPKPQMTNIQLRLAHYNLKLRC